MKKHTFLQSMHPKQTWRLQQAVTIKNSLEIYKIVCVFDQALSAKTAKVLWIIGKRFCDTGLQDLTVESGIIAKGSIQSHLVY